MKYHTFTCICFLSVNCQILTVNGLRSERENDFHIQFLTVQRNLINKKPQKPKNTVKQSHKDLVKIYNLYRTNGTVHRRKAGRKTIKYI